MPDDKDDGQINFVREAFHWQYNLIGLGGAAVFALISLSALPLLFGVLARPYEPAETAVLRNGSEINQLRPSCEQKRQATERYERERGSAAEADQVVLPVKRFFDVIDLAVVFVVGH